MDSKTFLNQCSVCSSSDLKVENISYENELYRSLLCNSCSFYETEKLENTISDDLKYSSKQYQLKEIYIVPLLLNFIDFLNYKLIFYKNGLNKSNHFLDFGCGKGLFLKFLSFFRYKNLNGLEIEKNRADFSKKINPKSKIFQNINELKQKKYDFISLIHVLEHIKNPDDIIKQLKTLLNNNKFLMIEVPNYNSLSSKIASKFWAHFTPQYHTNHFTLTSLKKILKSNNFDIVSCSTLNLYHGYNGVFSAFIKIIGFKSSNFYQSLKFNFFLFIPFYILLFPLIYFFELIFSLFERGSVIRIVCKNNF